MGLNGVPAAPLDGTRYNPAPAARTGVQCSGFRSQEGDVRFYPLLQFL